jgi:outer membrane protein
MSLQYLVVRLSPIALILLAAAPASAETLAEAAAAAVKRHPTLQADLATVKSSDENVVAARSAFFPVVTVGGEINLDRYTRASGPLNLTGREVGVEVNQLVYDGAGAWSQFVAIGAERRSLQADRDRNGNTVAYGVARAYLGVLRDRALLASAQRNLDEHHRSVSQLVAIVKHDAGKAFDLQQVRAREAFAASLVAERLAALKASEGVYVELIGRHPGELTLPAGMAGEGFEGLDQALDVAQRQHPMVLGAAHRAEAAGAEVGRTQSGMWPRLYATARYYTGIDRQAVLGWNNEGYAGIKASYLFGGETVSTVRTAREAEAAARARIDAARRDAREAVRVAWAQREGVIANLPPAEAALSQSMVVLDGFKTQYTFGRRTVLDLLIVQNDAFQAESRAVGLRFSRLLADYALAAHEGVLEARLLADVPAPAAPRQATATPDR